MEKKEQTDFEIENFDKEEYMATEILFDASGMILKKIEDGEVIPEYHFEEKK